RRVGNRHGGRCHALMLAKDAAGLCAKPHTHAVAPFRTPLCTVRNSAVSASEMRCTRSGGNSASPPSGLSIAENDTEQGAVDPERQFGVVLDETELRELVQEESHARPRRADHLGERFL